VLARITAPTVPLVAHDDGELAGVAIAVLQPESSIVFSVAVSPDHRRKGIATDLMAAWAENAGERTLFLQTFADNTAAQALYGGLGFTTSHRYHYRRAPAGTR
jgi:ribosomal protein S18 acetylase RimI-like enzyme